MRLRPPRHACRSPAIAASSRFVAELQRRQPARVRLRQARRRLKKREASDRRQDRHGGAGEGAGEQRSARAGRLGLGTRHRKRSFRGRACGRRRSRGFFSLRFRRDGFRLLAGRIALDHLAVRAFVAVARRRLARLGHRLMAFLVDHLSCVPEFSATYIREASRVGNSGATLINVENSAGSSGASAMLT